MKPTTSLLSFGLRGAAITALILTLGTWIATGSHVGWTQTSIVQMQHDEITGIDFPVHKDAFIAGVEVLAAGLFFASAFAGLSFLPRLQRVKAVQS
ncbi:hypothetical protein CMV30_16895 [Nibricoccus aquaticus]|uniref:Uncharacterized protein n=1 Tax=Nibricoccus aquaticus TaxID=2576891 RepID=A0A290QGT8_9BACT|nr:hypothetical protein [Nibricoccus aquaticus]ATC65486.1 hypothetical protein CMV30_16895 [Nibricoccus aquaticus]